jgi:hypothetical protein
VLWVGLAGGIGAGTSAVGRRLVERGAALVDADVVAREVVEPGTPGLAEAFGEGVLRPDRGLDREALGRLVFGDDDARARIAPQASDAERRAVADVVLVNDGPRRSRGCTRRSTAWSPSGLPRRSGWCSGCGSCAAPAPCGWSTSGAHPFPARRLRAGPDSVTESHPSGPVKVLRLRDDTHCA